MMTVSKEIEIDMGHTVTLHASKCKHLHGHRFLIRATVDGNIVEQGSATGMVIDFSDLKAAMMKVIDLPFDHAFVIWKEDPRAELLREAHELWHNDINKLHVVDFVPTAENLAAFWFKELDRELLPRGLTLVRVDVYETPTSCATFELPARCYVPGPGDFVCG